MRHCSAKHIELLISDDAATFVSPFVPRSSTNASRAALKARERQFRAAFDPRKTVEIARAIVGRKIKAEKHERLVEQEFFGALQQTKTTDDVRHVEAAAAQV
jgi:CRISPR/Cas system-associated endonuclease Cas1